MGKIISGLKNKSFAAQSGVYSIEFDYLFTKTGTNPQLFFDIGNETGEYHLRLREISGRLYDTESNYFYGVSKNQRVSIKTVTSGDLINLYVNNILSNTNYTSQDSLDYVNQLSINVLDGYVDVNLTISGEYPLFLFSGFNFIDKIATGTGYVSNSNPNLPFKIYSGQETQSGLYSFYADSGNISGTAKQLQLIRNYTLITEDDLSDNTTIYNFDIYSNFGIVNYDIPISTTFPVVQSLDIDQIIPFSQIGSGQAQINWANYKGEAPYNNPLLGTITFGYLSGISGANNFSGIFQVYTAGQGEDDSYLLANYNSSITGYQYNFTNTGSSGINYRLTRSITGASFLLKFDYSGYNTGYSYIYSGV